MMHYVSYQSAFLLFILVASWRSHWTTDASTVEVPAAVMDPNHPMSIVTRSLQDTPTTIQRPEDWQGSNSVENICQQFNDQLAGIMTCTCVRHGTAGKRIDCVFDGPQCDANQTLCYTGSITEYLNEDNASRAKETCSRYSTKGDAETCILVFPAALGNYTTLERCEAKYSPTGVDAAPCHSCTVCMEEEEENEEQNAVIDGATDPAEVQRMLKISLDCCNLQTDLKQTCNPISNGLALPWFDEIDDEEEGQCESVATQSTLAAGVFGLVASLLAYSTLM